MSTSIDLSPSEIVIKFTPGATVALSLYPISDRGIPISLEGWVGQLSVTDAAGTYMNLEWSVPVPAVPGLIDLGLGDVEVWGGYVEIPAVVTGRVQDPYYHFTCTFRSPLGETLVIAKGLFEAQE